MQICNIFQWLARFELVRNGRLKLFLNQWILRLHILHSAVKARSKVKWSSMLHTDPTVIIRLLRCWISEGESALYLTSACVSVLQEWRLAAMQNTVTVNYRKLRSPEPRRCVTSSSERKLCFTNNDKETAHNAFNFGNILLKYLLYLYSYFIYNMDLKHLKLTQSVKM